MAAENEKYVLAIDLSTSGTKTAIVSMTGIVCAMEYEPNEMILSHDGAAEQNPDLWWQNVKETSKRLIRQRLVPVEDIQAVSCTAQWSGTVAVDRDGRCLFNAMTWMDSRGHPYVKKITKGLINFRGYDAFKLFRWLRLTGGVPTHSGKDSIANILYLKNAQPEIYRRTYKFLEPKDFLNFKFTGKCAASYDSIALHWLTDNRNISKVVYDDRLFRMVDVDAQKLPELKQSVEILGSIKAEVASELGLNENVCVITGSPDIQSAAIGSGAVRDYQPHICIGTSSWMTCHIPFKKTSLRHHIASLPSSIPGRYLVTNEQESAGACLNWLKDNIFCHDGHLHHSEVPDALEVFNKQAATSPPGSNKLIFTPWLHGERTPVEDHSLRGCFFNQSLLTTRSDMIRAVFEGVAYNTRWLLECMEGFVKRPLNDINIIGGGATSDLWCQIFSDVMNRRINQVDDPVRANLRGAAFMAAVAMGYMSFDEIPDRINITESYKPIAANRNIYDKLHRAFKKIFRQNRAIFSELNGKEQ